MTRLLKTICLLLLLSGPVVALHGETSFDFTTSGGQQIKIIMGNSSDTQPRERASIKNYRYLGSVYPTLVIPNRYPVIWRIYYKINSPKLSGNQASTLYLWQKIRAWHQAQQDFYQSKLANPPATPNTPNLKSADNALKRERLNKILQQGLELFKKDKFTEAAQELKKGILLKPDDGVTAILYGHALFASGKYSLAAKALRRGMRSIKNFPATPMDLKEFYSKPEILTKQISQLETWVKYHPEDLETSFLLGYVYFFTSRLDKAIDTFKLLRKQNPLDAEAEALLTKALELKKK